MNNELREMDTTFVANSINANNNMKYATANEFEELIKGCNNLTKKKMRASFELGRRSVAVQDVKIKNKIGNSYDAYVHLRTSLEGLDHEEFWVLFLNHANVIIEKAKMTSGGIDSTIIDRRLIFKKAIKLGACAILLAHNHPTGNITPSKPDKQLTDKIFEAGMIMDIHVLDHIIVGKGEYFSFADEGLIL